MARLPPHLSHLPRLLEHYQHYHDITVIITIIKSECNFCFWEILFCFLFLVLGRSTSGSRTGSLDILRGDFLFLLGIAGLERKRKMKNIGL